MMMRKKWPLNVVKMSRKLLMNTTLRMSIALTAVVMMKMAMMLPMIEM